ncbi:MAG: DnaJ domain-containing protein [Syntrophobacteraceae bacterium]
MLDLDQSYQILGVQPSASMEELKQAFRKMAKAWHPDFFHHDPEFRKIAEEKLRQIINAYRVVSYQPLHDELQQDRRESAESKYRKCSDPNCSGVLGPDWRCSLCMKIHRPGPRPANGNGQTYPGAQAYKVHLCSICGRFNRLVEHYNVRRYLCWHCRNPLDWPGRIRALAPGPSTGKIKTHRFLGVRFSTPSLDYLKFLGFCFFFISLVAVACVGTAMFLWRGVTLISPFFH